MDKFLFTAINENEDDVTLELQIFAKSIGLESVASGRFSFLFLLQLFGETQSGTIDPIKVIRQINVLEGISVNYGLKAPTKFNGRLLRELWHQHYLETGIAGVAKNLKRAMDRYGLPYIYQKVAEAEASGEERFFTIEDAMQIAHDAVIVNRKRLIQDEALIGEWIIFAKYDNQNYYLCIAKHNTGDAAIRKLIDTMVIPQFSFFENHPNSKIMTIKMIEIWSSH